MIIQNFDLNLIPDSAPVVVHVDQYDHGTGRLRISLYEGDVPYEPSGTAQIQGSKPDGKGFLYNASLSGNVVTANLEEQMTAVAGKVLAQVVVTETSGRIGSFKFVLDVQKSALPDDTDMSESDYQAIEELIEEAHEVAEEVAEDRTAAENAATSAGNSAEDSEAWAKGTRNGTAVPPTDPTYQQNSKYWAGQAEQYAQGGLKFVGTIFFASLPTSGMRAGDMYNIKDAFTTDSRFEEGAGIRYPEGTNVAWTPNNKWDVLAGNIRVLVSITLAQFNALTPAQKNDPTIWWWVPDANNGTMGDSVSSVTAYPELTDLPQINGHTIIGNMNSSTLEIMGINDYVRAGLKPNTPIGTKATAEGSNVTASGYASHGEGIETKATGNYSHSEGYSTTASGHVSHAGGFGTIAAYANQTAMGIYNDNKSDTLFEVGNGSNNSNRSNAFEVYANGNVNVAGNIYRNNKPLFKEITVRIPLFSEIEIPANTQYSSFATINISEGASEWNNFLDLAASQYRLIDRNSIYFISEVSGGTVYSNGREITCSDPVVHMTSTSPKSGWFTFDAIRNFTQNTIKVNSVHFNVIYFPKIDQIAIDIRSR